jgi:tetratricopeptide (TPR) repeat protein
MNKFDPKNMNFLIVDDMDNMRRSIRAMLKLIQFGKEYYDAENGVEAWKILNNERPRVDFIISDWQMPKMNGIELLSKVRASKKLRDVPFLFITAETNQTFIAEAAENEVDAYLTKPFVTATLEQKILGLLKLLESPPPLMALLKEARALREDGDLDGAIACAKKAVKINNHSSRPLRELGRLFLQNQDQKSALACFQKAVQLNRMDVTAYHYMGQIYFAAGNIDKAIANYSMAVELSPRNSERAFKFSALLMGQKRLADAEKILKIVIKNNQSDVDLLEKIADSCLEQEVYGLAAKTYQSVLSEDPERWYLNKKIGLALQKSGNAQEAIAIFEKAIKSSPEDIEMLLSLAQSYIDIKMPIRAEKWATKVVRIDPKNSEARNILDQCL